MHDFMGNPKREFMDKIINNNIKFNDAVLEIFNKAEKIRKEEVQNIEQTKPISTGITTSVGLSGILVKDTGEITKTKYLDLLKVDESKYSDIQLTEEQAVKISKTLRHMTTGVNAAVPMICTASSCPFASSCPYLKEARAPLGRPCLVESQLISFWTEQFIDEFNVDMANSTEIYMVGELAEFNIYEMRITRYLAEKHPTLMQDVITGVDPAGNILENQEISRAFDLKDRIKRSRMKVLEALMATRKERVKLKVETVTSNSAASKLSDLKKKLEEVSKDIHKMQPIEGSIVNG